MSQKPLREFTLICEDVIYPIGTIARQVDTVEPYVRYRLLYNNETLEVVKGYQIENRPHIWKEITPVQYRMKFALAPHVYTNVEVEAASIEDAVRLAKSTLCEYHNNLREIDLTLEEAYPIPY